MVFHQFLTRACDRWLAFSFVFLMGITSASAADPPGWNLAWSDDFNTFDTTRWRKETSTSPTNNSRHAYLPSQVTTSGGNLLIKSENVPYQNLPYRSGQIFSLESRKLGRWEVRAKLPATRGMWPAIWLLPDTQQYPWPSGGEIDIMENRGNQPNRTSSAFHYGTNPPYNHQFVFSEQQTSINGALVNYTADYHTYAVEWRDSGVRFFVDDVNYYNIYDQDVGNFFSQKAKPMQLVINTAVGGDFLPNPDATTVWPQTFSVDWVKVYSIDPTPEPITSRNPGFDENNSLAGWTVFGNGNALAGNPNVSASNTVVRNGVAALKLFGAFNGDQYSGVSQGITVQGGQTVEAALESYIRSTDSLAGTGNRVFLKLEFYSEFGAKYGSNKMLGEQETLIADSTSPTNTWRSHSISFQAPAGAVEARLALVFNQPNNQGGSVYVDAASFGIVNPGAAMGDFNNDGLVNAADYSVWRDSNGQTGAALAADADRNRVVNQLDYNIWAQRFGAAASAATSIAAPEPSTQALAVLVGLALRRCRQL